jgi:CheY-like chemotaxis protein
MPAFENTPILLVEDSDDDLFFFRRLLSKAGIKSPVSVVTDGRQATAHFDAALNPALPQKPPLPRIVFLDLKLPLRSGVEVLQWIRTQAALKPVIGIVLSSSAELRDVKQAYELGAQGYVVKYPEPEVFSEIMRQIEATPPGSDLSKLKLPGLERPAA